MYLFVLANTFDVLQGLQASLKLEDRFRAKIGHLSHANTLATWYQDAKKKAAEAKNLVDATDVKRVEVEESLKAALESLTKVEYKLRAYDSEFDQAKRAAYEAGSKEAQEKMGCQLPGVCNEFYVEGWRAAVGFSSSGLMPLTPNPPSLSYPPPTTGADVVDLEDTEVTFVLAVEEPVGAGHLLQSMKEGAWLL